MTKPDPIEDAVRKFVAEVRALARSEFDDAFLTFTKALAFTNSLGHGNGAPVAFKAKKPPKEKPSAKVPMTANGVRQTKPTKKPKLTRTAAKAAANRRSPEEISMAAARLLTHINAHPSQRAEEIAKATGYSTAEISAPIRILLSEKKIKASGVARGTKYESI